MVYKNKSPFQGKSGQILFLERLVFQGMDMVIFHDKHDLTCVPFLEYAVFVPMSYDDLVSLFTP